VLNDVQAAFQEVSTANGQVPFVQNATPGISNRAWTPESQLLLDGSVHSGAVRHERADGVRERAEQMSTVDGLVGEIDIADEAAAAPGRFQRVVPEIRSEGRFGRVGCSRCRPW